MIRLKTTIFVALTVFFSFSLGAQEHTVTLGGASGWSRIESENGLSRVGGYLGQEALSLDSSSVLQSGGTDDLYLSFDEDTFPRIGGTDDTGSYRVLSNGLRNAGRSRNRRGTGAALSVPGAGGIVLRGSPGTLFGGMGDALSFTIEFWLLPAVTENGSSLFRYRTAYSGSLGQVYQYIDASVFRNHIEWTFSNIWIGSNGPLPRVTLSAGDNLVPGMWSHHALVYDAEYGLLEYRVDGLVQQVRYMTLTGREGGTLMPAFLGESAPLEIASSFSGIVDEFRISRGARQVSSVDERHRLLVPFNRNSGRFVSRPIDSGGIRSLLNRIEVVESLPTGTGTAWFVRSGTSFYDWTEDSPPWIPVVPGKPVSGIEGRFFQVSGELYPDASGHRSPVVTSVRLVLHADEPPLPPPRFLVEAGDRSIRVSWKPSIDRDVIGYLVYIGDRPGEYLHPRSPVDAGKNLSLVIDGLQNGKQYVVAIAAYDDAGRTSPGPLTAEMTVRPSAVNNNAFDSLSDNTSEPRRILPSNGRQ